MDDRIIRKPTALTEEEFELMKTHPAKGAAIMAAIPQLADVIPGMKYHHEKWEGGGYPDGLKGEADPAAGPDRDRRRHLRRDDDHAARTRRRWRSTYVVERIRQLAPSRFDPRSSRRS